MPSPSSPRPSSRSSRSRRGAEVEEPEQEPEEQDAQVLPWQPRFDQQDDLSGLLQARGRLLSRAFRGITADGA